VRFKVGDLVMIDPVFIRPGPHRVTGIRKLDYHDGRNVCRYQITIKGREYEFFEKELRPLPGLQRVKIRHGL